MVHVRTPDQDEAWDSEVDRSQLYFDPGTNKALGIFDKGEQKEVSRI